ncbi:MAG: anti-sigma factor [Vicinamibacterales bacterium]
MTCEDARPLVSALVDDELPGADAAAVRAHVETCAGCRGLLQDLQRIRDTARSLGPIPPPEHLWLEVAGQVRLGQDGGRAPARDHSATWQWAGLAAAIVAVTLGAYALSRVTAPSSTAAPTTTTAATDPSDPTARVQAVVDELSAAIEKAIGDLQTLAADTDHPAESELASQMLASLSVTDQAIAESRTALRLDPSNGPARDSLLEALRRKVDILQSTMMLINDLRLGDAEGAGQAAGLPKKSG